MKNTLIVLAMVSALAGCTSQGALQQARQAQQSQNSLLQQQSVRLEMHEEYMAQLAESQQELVVLLARVDARAARLEERLPAPTAQDTEESTAQEDAVDRGAPSTQISDPTQNKIIVGRNEWVWLELMNRNLKARVDTGALSSSLSAVELQPFERDGNNWIRFRVPDEEHPDGGDVYETPLVRWVRIRQASSEQLDRRPVIRLTVKLGNLIDEVEFNLTNREDMLYPVLLGRNFLRDVALVDVSQKFTQPQHQVPAASTGERGQTP